MRKTLYKQEKEYSCGPASIGAVLSWRHGIEVKEVHLRYLVGVKKSGSDTKDLAHAIAHFRLYPIEHSMESADLAVKALRKYANAGGAVICTDNWAHWMAVVGYRDKRFIVVDPLEGYVKTISKTELINLIDARETGYKRNKHFIGIEYGKRNSNLH